MVKQFDAILSGPARLQVVIGADPGDEVSFGRAVEGLVAEADHHASVGSEHAVVPVAGEAPVRVDGRRPGGAFVSAEHHQAASFVGVLAQQAGEFLTVGGAEHVGFARVLAGDFGDDPRFGPSEATVGGDHLQRHQRRLVGPAGAAVIEAERPSVFESYEAAEGHHAGQVERRHLLPGLTVVLAHDARHARPAAFAEGGGEDPEAGFAGRVDDAVDARAVLVGREALGQLRVEARPGQAAVFAAGHRTRGAAVVDAPYREDRLVVRHQQGRRVALVDRRRAGADDHLTFFLRREIDDG